MKIRLDVLRRPLELRIVFPTADTSAQQDVTEIIDSCNAFGVPKTLESDRPTNVKDEMIRTLDKSL